MVPGAKAGREGLADPEREELLPTAPDLLPQHQAVGAGVRNTGLQRGPALSADAARIPHPEPVCRRGWRTHRLMELKPYQQRVIDDLGDYLDLFQHIGGPAKTNNTYWERKAGPYEPLSNKG